MLKTRRDFPNSAFGSKQHLKKKIPFKIISQVWRKYSNVGLACVCVTMKTSCPHPPLAPFSTRFKLNTLSSTTSAERQRRWRADATTFPTTSQIHSYHSFSTSTQLVEMISETISLGISISSLFRFLSNILTEHTCFSVGTEKLWQRQITRNGTGWQQQQCLRINWED